MHQRHPERGELSDGGLPGEPLDAVVGGVHLEYEAGVRGDGLLVVLGGRPVGGADLPQPGAGTGEQVGKAEPVADLDQFAAADDDLPAAAGQRGGREDEGGRVVVHHAGRGGRGNRPPQRLDDAAAPLPGPRPRLQVELDVAGPRRGEQRVRRRAAERRAAQVGVHEDAGGVDDRGKRRGGRRQFRRRRVGHQVRGDLAAAGPVLCAGDRRLDQVPAHPALRRPHSRIGQQLVGSRDLPQQGGPGCGAAVAARHTVGCAVTEIIHARDHTPHAASPTPPGGLPGRARVPEAGPGQRPASVRPECG